MKKNILLEEQIGKIKKLSGINEAAPGPTQWIAKLIAGIQKAKLSDDVIKELESLSNSGKIAIDKTAKVIKTVDWANLTDDEVKLLFKADEVANVFEEIIKANKISTDAAAVSLYSPRFKKILNGYLDRGKVVKPVSDVTQDVVRQTIRVNTGVPSEVSEILSVQQTNSIRKEMDDFVRGNLDYNTISQVSKEDLSKMSQVQKLKENEAGLKILEAKALAERELIEQQKRLKELEIKAKELEIQLSKDQGNLQLKKEKAAISQHRWESRQAIVNIVYKMKWFILAGAILVFGWEKVWGMVKNVFSGVSIFNFGSGGSSKSNKGALD